MLQSASSNLINQVAWNLTLAHPPRLVSVFFLLMTLVWSKLATTSTAPFDEFINKILQDRKQCSAQLVSIYNNECLSTLFRSARFFAPREI